MRTFLASLAGLALGLSAGATLQAERCASSATLAAIGARRAALQAQAAATSAQVEAGASRAAVDGLVADVDDLRRCVIPGVWFDLGVVPVTRR